MVSVHIYSYSKALSLIFIQVIGFCSPLLRGASTVEAPFSIRHSLIGHEYSSITCGHVVELFVANVASKWIIIISIYNVRLVCILLNP